MHFSHMRLPIHLAAKRVHILFTLACPVFAEKVICLEVLAKHNIRWVELKLAIIFAKVTPKVVLL